MDGVVCGQFEPVDAGCVVPALPKELPATGLGRPRRNWARPSHRAGNLRSGPAHNECMKLKVVVHDAEEGGFWAEVPAIPGCVTEGDTWDELLKNLYDAVEGCLSVDVSGAVPDANAMVLDIAV